MSEVLIFLANTNLSEIVTSSACSDVFLIIKKIRVSLSEEQDEKMSINKLLQHYVKTYSEKESSVKEGSSLALCPPPHQVILEQSFYQDLHKMYQEEERKE